jgi:Zn-dependent protease with chaperone function
LARALIDADEGNDDDDEGGAALFGLAVFVCYLLSEFVVLWLSRTREFAADHWSCECTGNGDALVSALVTIGYGMTVSSAVAEASEKRAQSDPNKATSAKAEKQEAQSRRRAHLMQTMGIFDQSAAGGMVNGFLGGIDAQRAVAALRWEASNPWAAVF